MSASTFRQAAARSQRGFSLVELMMVIAIIGVLASYATEMGRVATISAKRTEAKAQTHVVQMTVEDYLATHGAFPGPYTPWFWFQQIPLVDEATGCPVPNFLGYMPACGKYYSIKMTYQPGGTAYMIETDNRANQVCPIAYNDILYTYGNTYHDSGWWGTYDGVDHYGEQCWLRDAIIDGCRTDFYLNSCDFPFAGNTQPAFP